MILKSYRPKSVFIGRPSNGANGDVTTIPLPYNVSVSISGLDWHYFDGSQLQRNGITPDIEVKRTFEELVLGEDTIYEQALEYIKKEDQ